MPKIPNVKLNNGVLMSQEGFGVFQIDDYEQCKQAVKNALKVGYRAIDTAQAYYNEQAVGDAIQESNVNRQDIFLTTKVWITNYGEQATQHSIDESLRELKTDYLDLVLLHQPLNDYYGAYRGLEKAYHDGKIRAIGVSNFNASKYLDLINNMEVIPAVDQVETHIFNQEQQTHQYLKAHHTQIESWGPFAEGKNNLFTNPILKVIGEKHHHSAAQVALRYLVQNGVVIIPKSTHIERMQQNLNIWDFTLNPDEMATIKSSDLNHSLFIDYNDPGAIKMLNQFSGVNK